MRRRRAGDKFPKDYMGGNGPEALKTEAEIIQFLRAGNKTLPEIRSGHLSGLTVIQLQQLLATNEVIPPGTQGSDVRRAWHV